MWEAIGGWGVQNHARRCHMLGAGRGPGDPGWSWYRDEIMPRDTEMVLMRDHARLLGALWGDEWRQGRVGRLLAGWRTVFVGTLRYVGVSGAG